MNKDKWLKGINLQLFAEDQDDTDDKADENVGDEDNKDDKDTKVYTKEEVDKLLQQEGDRRVSAARDKFEKDYSTKLEEEKKEAKRLAKLSSDEREKELLKKKEEDIAAREQQLQYKELELDTVDRLVEEELPVTFKNFVIKEDAETTNENIKLFKTEWLKALDAAVNEKLKGKTPGGSQGGIKTTESIDINKLAEDNRII